jgi:hypothetical protein
MLFNRLIVGEQYAPTRSTRLLESDISFAANVGKRPDLYVKPEIMRK